MHLLLKKTQQAWARDFCRLFLRKTTPTTKEMHWIKYLQPRRCSRIKILLKFPGQNQGSESHSIQTLPLLGMVVVILLCLLAVHPRPLGLPLGPGLTILATTAMRTKQRKQQLGAWSLSQPLLKVRSEHIKILGYLGRCRTISLEALHNSNNWFLWWSQFYLLHGDKFYLRNKHHLSWMYTYIDCTLQGVRALVFFFFFG